MVLEEQCNNKSKNEFIRNQHALFIEKKKNSVKEKVLNKRKEYEEKILEEQKNKEECEGRQNVLEKEEIEVLNRIKTTTKIHQSSKVLI